MRRSSSFVSYIMLLPGLLVLFFYLIMPLAFIVFVSFLAKFDLTNPAFTLYNYVRVFTSPQTWVILSNTFGMSLLACAVTLLVGYPAAYFLAFHVQSRAVKNLVISLLLVPFLIDWNIRSIAWIPILGEGGAVNYLLRTTGLIEQPISFLYSRWTLIFMWLQSNILFMVFPIYLALSRIDPDVINAAKALKAPPHRVFYDVIFKLSLPGVVVGIVFVFVSTLGDYITPSLWAGGLQMLGLSIAQNAANFVWPYAATQALVLVSVALSVLVILFKIVNIKQLIE